MSLQDMMRIAMREALRDAAVEKEQLDAIFFGNMMGGILENSLHMGALIAEELGLHIPVYRYEAACASGGMAFQQANTYLHANADKTVLVVGAEKMTDAGAGRITQALAAAAGIDEQFAGLTFPGLYGMLARTYLDTYKYGEEHLAHVAVKNHFHGARNKKAQFRKEITVEQVLKSPMVASPLKMLDCSPITDGAAAVVLTNTSALINKAEKKVHVMSSELATDSITLKGRKRLDSLEATVIAAQKAFATAKLTPQDIQIAEVHDCFTIAELLAMEDIGFWKRGEAGNRAMNYESKLGSGSGLTVNTSGGLKAAGHPVGATGIKQIGELFFQLTGTAENRQVEHAKHGLAHNVGGSGGTAVVTILKQL
jgi:acetyl-CoA C-acetyltransferase